MPRATRNAVRLSSRTRWFVRPLRPVLKFSILLSFMRIEHPLCDSIGRRKGKSVTPQFAECNSFVTLWTVGGRLQNARYFLAPLEACYLVGGRKRRPRPRNLGSHGKQVAKVARDNRKQLGQFQL